MAESEVLFALGRLGLLLIGEAISFEGVKQLVEEIQIELKHIKCFLKDADQRQDEDETIRNLVSEIREVAYEADDVINTFVDKDTLRRDHVLKRYSCIFNEVIQYYMFKSEIHTIKSRISNLITKLENYGVRKARSEGEGPSPQGSTRAQLRRSYPHMEVDIVGFEDQITKLIQGIVKESEVVSICGMGGSGKTTLAKSIFHHDQDTAEISTKKLIRMWVAEGLVHSTRTDDEETVAEKYLHELIDRSVIEVGQVRLSGRIKTCRLHDLMRDLSIAFAEKENFFKIVRQQGNMYQLPKLFRNGRVHRLAIVGNGSNCKVTEELESHDRNCKNLRSLVLYGVKEQELRYLLEHFRLLRVLDLVGIYDNTSDIVDKSKYDIVGNGKLQLANLRNLQTLVNLRIGTCELQDLLELRDTIRKLVLIFGEEEEHLNEFRAIFRFSEIIFSELQFLSSKSDRFPFSELAVETIDPIASGCCPKLYKLRVEMKIGELPSYRKFCNSITELILACCRLEEDPMPTLGKLPNLEILHLEWFAFIGREMACTRKGFPKLKSLILKQLKHLEEWKVEEDAMSCLCHLEIIDCFALKNIPIQLRFIATLKELKIENRHMPQELIDGIRPREQILTRPMILHSM
ncbi:NB-ARC domain-containing protein [Corchorus olitorius]|uniref:NB-ARC domain-containing protein n=1 Tax=Corchorus olitorius TaxID=93759 RepID=A0A1R3KU87_9ROSI|nr:NB-ARC domain-containing protein [Corchorus olitorius]